MLDLANVSLIVGSDALVDEIQAEGRRYVSVTASGDSTVKLTEKSLATPATIESPAYLLFTSGSTGEPKGVICKHRGVVNLLEAFEQLNCLPDGANCAWWCSASFDVSVYEIYSALAFGRTLHIVPEQVRADGERLFAWLSEQRIQSAYLPPFILNQMRVLLEKGPATLHLERLLVGVEPIPEETLAGIAAALPKLQIINGYGPTEATICTTLYLLPERPTRGRNAPIGRPVRNTSLYLLDAARRLVPFGAVGEIYVGGDGLACGYLNRPDLTDASFVANTFSSDPKARLYKTGDLARYLPNGDLIHLGRVDDQIKLRGQRIEPGEVERALLAHPSVRDALVIAEKVDDDKRLVAYLVVAPLHGISAAEWAQWLETRLARFMIPSAYVVLDAFPLTTSGKIDRNALPAPEYCDHATQASRPPAGPLEVELANIFMKVLELREIGVETHFIELGGDSIRAMQIAALASDAGMQLSPRQIFETGTIASLALVLQDSPQASEPIRSEAGNPVSARELAEVFAEFGEDPDSVGD
jgi:amino acid adenylation domain-containing protein